MRALPRHVLFALLTIYIVWGSTYFAIHVALQSFPPFILMGSRFLVAGALLFGWLKWRGTANPTPRQWRDAGIVGVLLLGGGMGLTAVAQQYVSSGMTAVFIACSPMIMSLCAGLFGAWPNKREWTGILVGFSGAVLLSGSGELSAQPLGMMALLGAIVCWDMGSIISQKKCQVAPGAMGFASEMLLGGVFLIVMAFAKGESFSMSITLPAFFAWSYLVVAGSLLAFSAYMYLLSKVTPALASSYAYVNPVIAVALGVMLAGEQIEPRAFIAIAIILASVALITLARAPSPEPA